MKTILRTSLAVLAVTFLASASGHAAPHHHHPYFSTPEIDPSMASGALALVGGAIVVIRGRRRNKA